MWPLELGSSFLASTWPSQSKRETFSIHTGWSDSQDERVAGIDQETAFLASSVGHIPRKISFKMQTPGL